MTVRELIKELFLFDQDAKVLIGSKIHRFNNDYFTDVLSTKELKVFEDGLFYKDATNALADLDAAKKPYVAPTPIPPLVKSVVLVGKTA